jgi:hypothetical protein
LAVDVAIVIPAYNAVEHLPRSLPAALAAAGESRVVVVDAGSLDATGKVARAIGAEVIRLRERAGPAEARNVGAKYLDAGVVLFIDSDCVAHPDVVERVHHAFSTDPELVSLTGSYDDNPPERNFFSQYMNLRHHYTHQQARTEHASFWAGCGAVRRSAFMTVGGFDQTRFPRPSVEDIELGLRLREVGRTRLDPNLQVTHLKRWTLRSVVETDVRFRALPWGLLILQAGIPNDLNLRTSQRVAAGVAPLALAGLVGAVVAVLFGMGRLLALSLAPVLVSLMLHLHLLRYFSGIRGLPFAITFWLFQQVHLSYSAVVMLVCFLLHRYARQTGPPSPGTRSEPGGTSGPQL